jgi:serine/threonine-protein kinase
VDEKRQKPPATPSTAGTLLSAPHPVVPLPGTIADRYQVVRELGHGGMGRVYVAHDQKLGRDVAVKVLAPHAQSEDLLRRFELEARATAALNHPNILDVHDIGVWHDEPYIVSELLEGETLRNRLRRGPLPPAEAAALALQLAQGLGAAHDKGVIHRDLKPENLFVTNEARLKILDFGIAKLIAAPSTGSGETQTAVRHTETGTIMGTVGYMSPEQVRGEHVDRRADIFSAGAVLYEMLAGGLPFDRETPLATGAAILNDDPPELPVQVPLVLDKIVRRCLEKDPKDRYPSAKEFASDLQAALAGPLVPSRRRRVHPALALAGAGLVAGAAVYFLRGRTQPAAEPPRPAPIASQAAAVAPSIAVLPFADLSPKRDQEYFSDGLAEEILDALAHVEGLRVTGRTSSFSFKGKNEDVQSIAQKLHVAAVLEGSVRSQGTHLRITAQLINAADGFQMWSQIFDRQLKAVFAVQEEISAAVVQALRIKLLPGRSALPVVRKTTPEAHAEYLIARQLLNRGSAEGFRRAEEAFTRALKLDPDYAPAWVGLAHAAYYSSGLARTAAEGQEATDRAIAAAERAVALGSDLGEAWAVRGWLRGFVNWDWQGSEMDLKTALRLTSGDAQVWRRYGFLLASLGRLPEAVAAVRKSAELDPLAAEAWDNLGYLATASGDLAEARSASTRALEIAPEQAYAADHIAIADLLENHPARALATFEKSGEEVFRLQGIAMAQHDLGRAAESQRALDELAKKYGHSSAFQIAQAYAWRGDRDRAFEWLERGYRQRDGGLGFLKSDPLLRKIRGDPRYVELLRKMKLPPG